MVLLDDWENPAYRENEEKNLAMLLDEINDGTLSYDGTSKEDIKRRKDEIIGKEEQHITESELYDYIHLLSDYCVGMIINSGDIEQMKYYRRLEKLQDQIDKIDESYGESYEIDKSIEGSLSPLREILKKLSHYDF